MDLLKSHKRRSRLSDFAYVILNVAMAVALLIAVRYGQSPWLAIGLVLLSKWRALAVKPRFWFANIVANMVDIIVGISVVVLMYAAAGEWLPQIGLTVAYVVWLLLIKPKSNKKMVTVQAGVSVFMGITALATVSYSWDSFFFIVFLWLIGYTAARHLLGSYDEPITLIYSLIVGLIFIEIGWTAYHWMFAYAIPGMGNIKIPQLAIILTLLALIAERAYISYRKHGSVKKQDILLPILLTLGVIVVLFVFFNRIALNTAL